ncbi:MAG: LysM peptidoglycan-binding domain-containing protein [Lachnospiraceae bacterium]|nr:LysM peptidoglycan-binding domain-containing protein [Lachnospiraceae bacterium]
MDKRLGWTAKAAIFMIMLLGISTDSHAYFGQNEDYYLTDEKPEGRGRGHYLEFVSEETYTVKSGDTLWKIAEDYWGNGTYYQRIWSDNEDVVSIPEHLMPGMELKLEKTLYTKVGIEDYLNRDQFRHDLIVDEEAFEIEDAFGRKDFTPPYCIYVSVPYMNDLKEVDPYVYWEEFKEEVYRCSKEICGDLVSDLSFERYQVTGIGNLCGYHFTFDAGDKEYVIMAYFCYNSTTKSEAFALCEKEYCTEAILELVRGKTCYAAVRFLDPGVYYVKAQDYVGAEEWNYPQLRNPFVNAMQRLYSGPLEQVEDYPDDYAIEWREPEFEKLVREELAGLWQLTEEEKQAFMERDVTASDLAGIEEMELSYYSIEHGGEEEYLRVRLNGSADNGSDITLYSPVEERLMGTLEDLRHFRGLKSLNLMLRAPSITDLSCIENLTNLRVLDMNIHSADTKVKDVDFLGKLTNLRTLRMGGWYWKAEYNEYFEGITDLSILRNCPHLAYLTLKAGNVESYDFLGDLPDIYYIYLSEVRGGKNIVPEESLLPNACFIDIYGEQVRYENGVGYD